MHPPIAGRRPPPSEFTLLWSERNAWRQIYQLMADGSTLKTAMKTIKEDQLFWTREVYERVLFQQLKTPRDPKGKGKGKDKGKKGGKTKGVYQDHLKNNPGKGNGKNDKSSKGVVPMDGLRTGHFRHPMESSIAVISISNIPAQGTAADPMLAQ